SIGQGISTMQEQKTAHNNLSRREFIRWLGWGSIIAPVLISAFATVRFLLPNVNYGSSTIVKIGKPEDFPPGAQKLLPDSKIVVNATNGGLFAMSAVCTHLGCTVGSVEWGYQCPCHGSKFDRNGLVIRGPAPDPLPWLKIDQAPDGSLVVDLERTVPRGTLFQL
ncbi:MAG: Rieske 2Fe-2S domain-containing protein, partial [Dehalococcoidia bacterium]|nr:Rieske 2Fe-2S domain-containing protein [Dehalococcoidia bacterium]